MSRKNILVVDKDKDFLRQIREDFLPHAAGYQVAFALNTAKANEILTKFKVHLVMTNIQLAGESGIELLINTRRWHRGIHVVLYGDNLSEELKRAAYHNGAAAILNMPVTIKKLLPVLSTILAKETESTFLDTLQLADLLQLIAMARHSADILVIGSEHQRGIIRIQQGQLIEADSKGKQGDEAISEMLSWQNPTIKPCKVSGGGPCPQGESLQQVLMKAVTRLDEN
ncbi:MAG: DUF4388 domain-containing protein [Desulfobulbaceae bacterium]|nr:DUF4388 domain-containing protein [Desulfobulbaceae bacterium]